MSLEPSSLFCIASIIKSTLLGGWNVRVYLNAALKPTKFSQDTMAVLNGFTDSIILNSPCSCLVTLYPEQGQPFLYGVGIWYYFCVPPKKTMLSGNILPYLSIGVLHVSILQQISCSQRYISFPYVTFFLIGTSLVSAILLICNLKTVWHASKRIQ